MTPEFKPSDIPLRILVCDAEMASADLLVSALRRRSLEAATSRTPVQAASLVANDDINTVFIDPLSVGLEAASEFIFETRRTHPEIVFVLYLNRAQAERERDTFFMGERHRFAHYYSLDKQTSVATFDDELEAALKLCRQDLSWRMSSESIQRLLQRVQNPLLLNIPHQDPTFNAELKESLDQLRQARGQMDRPNSVFLSYRFAETEYVEGLASLLRDHGFDVVTGREANTSISRAVVERIRECAYFLSLMTRQDEKVDGTFCTSAWLHQELGAAIATGKLYVLMVEDGVSDLGGLQGDWQRIAFAPKSFLLAARQAVRQLRSYAGRAEPTSKTAG